MEIPLHVSMVYAISLLPCGVLARISCMFQIFLALRAGAALVMVPTTVKMSPCQLAEVLFRRCSVTVLQATPSLIHRLPNINDLLGDNSLVRIAAFGGENCPSLKWIGRHKTSNVS